uniref:Receptor expression-enhancing protein n=1 Tax=Anopheles minimus TaxID=112268 RepID=A0A182W1L9_9DIPT
MYRKQQRIEQRSPCYIPQTQDALNNVSDLISKFEVRNYPINRGLLPELSPPRAGFIVPGTESYEASYRPYGGGSPRNVYQHYSPTHSPPLGQTRRRLSNRLPCESQLNDTASLSDGGDSVQSGRMDGRQFRQRPPGGLYYQNGSLSSLNESDYYEEVFDVGPRTPPTGRFYQQQHQQRYGDGVLLEEVDEAPLNKEQVTSTLTRFGAILQMLSRIPFPRMSVTGMGLCSLVAIFFCPRAIGSNILFPGFRLLFGTLYPAYASYKAVRTKNVKEYVKWMMYWIVFAFFTFIETFTDILLSWFPFYYEIKVIVVLWLLSPATRGSSTLYRKFVHPMLTRREQEIDDYINQAKEKGYTAVLQLGSKGVNYATNVIMQTAIKVLGTKTDTPFSSMMRISQSDNSLLMSAAAAAARATTGDPFASGSVTTMHTNGLNTNYRATGATSGEDKADGGSLMGTETEQQYNVPATSPLPATRVRRSQSVDSALNSRVPARSGTSRSVTRSRAAANLQQHAVIYEMDSEDEERFLATETDLILGPSATSTTTASNTGRIRGRARAITAISGSEESDGTTETGASRSGGTAKVKTSAKDTARAKKTVKGTTSKAATKTAPTGRRKANTETDSGGGGLVQTLRKSYSLSDLSEPDTQRTQDEVDEIVNRPQRVLRSKSSRSSSGSRQMEMYFPEVEIAGAPYHATAAPPYNYIRSSDDISSGYSSAEPGLSRTASMSNTARPRLKSKTREDQDEYGTDVFYDEQNVFYADSSNHEGIRSSSFIPQRASIYELHAGSSLPAITQAEHTVETATSPTYSSATQSAQRIGNVPPEMNDKYKLFLAWMEEQQKREKEVEHPTNGMETSNNTKLEDSNSSQQDTETGKEIERSFIREQELVASVKQEETENNSIERSKSSPEEIATRVEPMQDDLSAMDDNFMDTISVSSNENDEFLEVEVTTDSTADLNNHEEEQQKDTSKDNPVEDIKETPESVTIPEEIIVTELNVNLDVESQQKMTEEATELPSVIEEKEQQQDAVSEEHLAKDVITPTESSNLMVASCSNSNLTSSSSSLAVSEGSTGSVINLAAEGAPSVPGKKHPSFGKQRKAPPVPPPPEMIVIREPPKIAPTITPPSIPSNPTNGEVLIEKRSVSAIPRTTAPMAAAPEKSKPKKFMSSLTGMFKGHGDTATSSSRSNESAQSQPSMGHPKETEI